MSRFIPIVLAFVLLSAGVGAQEPAAVVVPAAAPPPFDVWLTDVRTEALSRGIRPEIVDAALGGVQPVDQILERDRTQAEFALELDAYLKRRLTRDAIHTARRMYVRHRVLLEKIARKYGVSARIIVALWGLESNFGRFAGVRPTFPTLATLAYDPRRASMFRGELFSALEILNRGDIELETMRGSWAGALGQPQFMPSSYLQFAQDFDGDGRRDIWRSRADVFASIAYYLRQHGWSDALTWGREVRIPASAKATIDAMPRREAGCKAEQLMTYPRTLTEWRHLGLRTTGNALVRGGPTPASLVTGRSRTFLVYSNYDALLAYNCAHSYALSVGLMADKLKVRSTK